MNNNNLVWFKWIKFKFSLTIGIVVPLVVRPTNTFKDLHALGLIPATLGLEDGNLLCIKLSRSVLNLDSSIETIWDK